nr:glucose 1-dehydrogenase [Bradyrhizobium sp. DOA9]
MPPGKLETSGKVTIITGSSRGIGRQLALDCALAGNPVIVNYVSSKAAADQIVQAIADAGGGAFAVRADVSDGTQVDHLIAAAIEKIGKLDCVINNAGVGNRIEQSRLDHGNGRFEAGSALLYDRIKVPPQLQSRAPLLRAQRRCRPRYERRRGTYCAWDGSRHPLQASRCRRPNLSDSPGRLQTTGSAFARAPIDGSQDRTDGNASRGHRAVFARAARGGPEHRPCARSSTSRRQQPWRRRRPRMTP